MGNGPLRSSSPDIFVIVPCLYVGLGHRNYSRETLRAALEAVKTRKISMRKAAKDFGVPCSTISRLAKEENPFKRRGRGPLFTEEEEEDLIR